MSTIRRIQPSSRTSSADAREQVDHAEFEKHGVRPSTPSEQARIRALLARRARLA